MVMRSEKRGMPASKKMKHGGFYLLARFLIVLSRILPRRLVLIIFGFLGCAIFVLAGGLRRRALDNLRVAYGDSISSRELNRLALRSFVELARNAAEAARLSGLSKRDIDRHVSVRGIEYVDRALAAGRGLIAVTGHLGNWELIPVYFALRGIPVNVVARRLNDSRLDRLVVAYREKHGVRNIDRDSGARAALRCLRRGEALGVLIDQDTRVDSVFVDFLGRPASTPSGPASLAMRTGAPVVPVATHRDRRGKHIIEIGEPIELITGGSGGEALRENTERLSKAVERFILRHPAQWVWIHERWKTEPPGGTTAVSTGAAQGAGSCR
jgi:KDO2-lipid IV(A) lauroyltransferase